MICSGVSNRFSETPDKMCGLEASVRFFSGAVYHLLGSQFGIQIGKPCHGTRNCHSYTWDLHIYIYTNIHFKQLHMEYWVAFPCRHHEMVDSVGPHFFTAGPFRDGTRNGGTTHSHKLPVPLLEGKPQFCIVLHGKRWK